MFVFLFSVVHIKSSLHFYSLVRILTIVWSTELVIISTCNGVCAINVYISYLRQAVIVNKTVWRWSTGVMSTLRQFRYLQEAQ